MNFKESTPRGRVDIVCRKCGERFRITEKELRVIANTHDGLCPCRKCGSTNTHWVFAEEG